MVLDKQFDRARRRVASTGFMSTLAQHGVPQDKFFMILLLVVLHLAASYQTPALLLPVGAAVVAGVIVDGAYNRVRNKPGFPGGAVITALIVSGITFPGNTEMAVGITVLSLLLKHVFAVDGRNLFNPAAFGLLVGASLFGTGLLWWLAASPLVFVLGFLVAVWLRVHVVAFSFLLTYWALTAATSPTFLNNGVSALIGGYAVFFAFIMVVEPVTSPNRFRSKLVYGAGVAVCALVLDLVAPTLSALGVPIVDNLLLGLLVMNLVHRVVPKWLP